MSDLAVRAAQRADLHVRSADRLAQRLCAKYPDRITGYFSLPATAGRYCPFPDTLSDATQRALHCR